MKPYLLAIRRRESCDWHHRTEITAQRPPRRDSPQLSIWPYGDSPRPVNLGPPANLAELRSLGAVLACPYGASPHAVDLTGQSRTLSEYNATGNHGLFEWVG